MSKEIVYDGLASIERIIEYLQSIELTKPVSTSPWLTIKEACAYLKCGRTKFYQLLNHGELKFYRLDKKPNSTIRILKRDINHYMIFQKKVRFSNSEKELLNKVSE